MRLRVWENKSKRREDESRKKQKELLVPSFDSRAVSAVRSRLQSRPRMDPESEGKKWTGLACSGDARTWSWCRRRCRRCSWRRPRSRATAPFRREGPPSTSAQSALVTPAKTLGDYSHVFKNKTTQTFAGRGLDRHCVTTGYNPELAAHTYRDTEGGAVSRGTESDRGERKPS